MGRVELEAVPDDEGRVQLEVPREWGPTRIRVALERAPTPRNGSARPHGSTPTGTLVDSFTDLRSTLDACGFALLTVDRSDRIAVVNEPFLHMWSLTRNELGDRLGPTAKGMLSERFAEAHRFLRFLNEVHSAPRPATEAFRAADGRTIEVRSHPWIRAGEVAGTVFSFLDVTQHQKTEDLLRTSEARLWEMATRDTLTGLSNRRHLLERLETELRRARRRNEQFVVAMLDLDHFKKVNDQLGHMEGDVVLQQFASILKGRLRHSDVVGRYGGEEFVCALSGTELVAAIPVLDEIRRAVRGLSRGRCGLSLSLGVSRYPQDAVDVERLLDVADQRLYAAKRAGRDRIVAHDGPLDPVEQTA